MRRPIGVGCRCKRKTRLVKIGVSTAWFALILASAVFVNSHALKLKIVKHSEQGVSSVQLICLPFYEFALSVKNLDMDAAQAAGDLRAMGEHNDQFALCRALQHRRDLLAALFVEAVQTFV